MATRKLDRIELARVKYVPKEPKAGVLYVAEEYRAAVHLCACGCGSKVSTPLGPTEWSFSETQAGPTLDPSIGNWQMPCRSHYWIRDGKVVWAGAWSEAQIAAGRKREEARREAYFDGRASKPKGFRLRLWDWIRGWFR